MRIGFGGKVILLDPFLTRNRRARPSQGLCPDDMSDADYVFCTHGHFDHIADVPDIVRASQARVYCSTVAARTLEKKGVPPARITTLTGGEKVEPDGFGVSVATSRHIRFDLKLLLKTMPGVLREARTVIPGLVGMPAGPVLIFTFDFGGLEVVDMGSLGITIPQVLEKRIRFPDVLFLPVQGHSNICARAADVTAAVRPRAVVPTHYDDFFPPVSRMIGLEPFRQRVTELLPECLYYEPAINREFNWDDLSGKPAGAYPDG
jgi:L-ascorbate metabolism protein UlaG (beta-lactamase superfamily)